MKETINKVKRQLSEWEKIIANENNVQTINLQNIQAAHAAQGQKIEQPSQKVGRRPKQIFSAHHPSLLEKYKSKPQ